MADEQKPEGEGEWKRLGPYQLHEEVAQSTREHGVLYLATHETSGAAALVLEPARKDAKPPGDWEVGCVCSSDPGYLAVEVERSPWTVANDEHTAEELEGTFEDLRDGVERIARAFPAANEPRPGSRLGLALAGTAAVCALAFVLMHQAPASPPPANPHAVASVGPAPMSDEVPTNTAAPLTGNAIVGIEDGGIPALAHPFPRKPYKGQKRPPCTPRVEVEIMDACWVPHELKAPCPKELYEYQGKCYTTSMLPPPTPQSVEP
ncbi:hypothetical protein [Archangium sp.]|uniref:hypothetical protein n=1 Tax=Archangium sp. TaxID=1872627 RepID=UPI00389A49DC